MSLTGNQIRQKFLDYFESKQHQHVTSASLVPHNDPTLFFINAGMVQFKDVFTGREKRDYTRAVSSQKCMRVSGKHNDLENVGRTPRHHTFFEMLGNFSFGDYFKKEAIAYAWEFLTEVLKIPAEPLWVTIYKDDEEAEKLWQEVVGFPKEKIVKCGEKDNFWSMGDTGPCGPCSEIHIDLGYYLDGKKSAGDPVSHEEDFMEIWNLVFMQFNRDSDGNQTSLPKPSIDTGMGLERLATVLQKKRTNYDTDLFQPLIQDLSKLVGKEYGKDDETNVSLRVLADHVRAATFLIGDGVQPSNEGRGYVLRRIMRRAIRHGRLLGMTKAFLYKVIPGFIDQMKEAYPDLVDNQNFIIKVIHNEEDRFLETLDKGLQIIEDEIANLKSQKQDTFHGEVVFQLYDTFGFPVDLTQLIAQENNLKVDMVAFDAAMQAQKDRARAAWKGSGQDQVGDIYHQLVQEGKTCEFLGYEGLEAKAKIVGLISQGKLVNEVKAGDEVEIFVDQTPFYGESGGQVGDQGWIESDKVKVEISDTQKPLDGLFSHHGKVVSGNLKLGDEIQLKVNLESRKPTMLNHTATHIMNAALREVLGDHVKQAGSVVDSQRLRFDFSHFEAVTKDQIQEIEDKVNRVIQANYPVTKEEMGIDDAKKKGALAFFGEKYGDIVRVVSVGDYSVEFCGGTHLNASGEIGAFKIISESSVASGVRRIEAVTGMAAIKEFQKAKNQLDELSFLLKAQPQELGDRIQKLTQQVKNLNQQVSDLKTKLATGGSSGQDMMSQVQEIKGIKVLAMEAPIDDPKDLRAFSDTAIQKLGSGILVLGAKADDKVSLLVRVSKDLTSQYKAGDLIKELAPIVGGKGGGRPDMAQAGGKDVEKLPEALKKVGELIG